MRDERGFSLVELVVSIAAGMVVLLGIFALFDVTSSNSARIAARVEANQRAKPVMQRLMNDLHSACIGRGIPPVLVGSTPTELRFQSQTGQAVNPTPDRHVVTYANGSLSERVFVATSGQAPTWTFSTTPIENRVLITDVGPATPTPLFTYYAADAGALSTTPLTTPLSAVDAARTVQVKVNFLAEPSNTPVDDANAPIEISDAVVFRYSPFSEDPTKVNGPCT